MKVQISHSIETDTIPEKVQELTEELNNKIHTEVVCRLVNASRIVSTRDRDSVEFALKDLVPMRDTLQDIASLYDDILSITHGYLQVLEALQQEALSRATATTAELQNTIQAAQQAVAATADQAVPAENTTAKKKKTSKAK
tara:strand:- start:1733 stop:2155 length:423 start_codon:yes stop_codon:yes gene_type:complete